MKLDFIPTKETHPLFLSDLKKMEGIYEIQGNKTECLISLSDFLNTNRLYRLLGYGGEIKKGMIQPLETHQEEVWMRFKYRRLENISVSFSF